MESATHPWRAILHAWIAFVLIAVGCAIAFPKVETSDADYRTGESGRADAMIAQAGLDQPDTENIIITAPSPAAWTRPKPKRQPTSSSPA